MTQIQRKPQILVVDDEVAMVRSLELLFKPFADIHKAYSVPEAQEVLEKKIQIDCIVTDVSMPEASGLTILPLVTKMGLAIPVIVMTAYSSVPQAVEAIKSGAFQYLVKPFENDEMVAAVKRAIAKKGIAYGESRSMPAGWICNSQSMKEFLVKAERAAESRLLLIVGETGVGKGRAARWIHEISSRSKKEFYVIDGRTHIEDFQDLRRVLQKGGTLFIAEVFNLNRSVQDQILDLMFNDKISIIASSSSEPEFQALSNYHKDLYLRLKEVVLRMPSLKQRAEDIEALIYHAIDQLKEKLKIKNLTIEPLALSKLKQVTFPGNVRELERVLERAVLESRTGIISEDLILGSESELKDLLPFSIPLENGWLRLEGLRNALEKELILRALAKFPDKSNTEIAQILGTTRRIMELRIKEYGIREIS